MGDNLTEQKYLELCDEFKTVMGEKDKALEVLRTNCKILGKIVAESYGVVKIIDNTLSNIGSDLDSVVMVKKLIEVLRTDLSDTVEEMIVADL
jgi:hypothetical protein|tara:strand:- start:1069 stop:1347 length:279 start_codon:yes stop_codon:yes gene_type:complete